MNVISVQKTFPYLQRTIAYKLYIFQCFMSTKKVIKPAVPVKSISEKTFQIIIRSEIITIIMKIFLKTACVDIPSVDKSASVDN